MPVKSTGDHICTDGQVRATDAAGKCPNCGAVCLEWTAGDLTLQTKQAAYRKAVSDLAGATAITRAALVAALILAEQDLIGAGGTP